MKESESERKRKWNKTKQGRNGFRVGMGVSIKEGKGKKAVE